MNDLKKYANKNKHRLSKLATKNDGSGRVATLERIKNSYLNDDENDLTEEESRMLARYKTVFSMLMRHNPVIKQHQICKSLMDLYGVSERTAYFDIKNSQELFGKVMVANKAFQKLKYVSWLENIISLSIIQGDYGTATVAIREAAKIQNLDQEDTSQDASAKTYNLNILVNSDTGTQLVHVDMEKFGDLSAMEVSTLASIINKPKIDNNVMDQLITEYEELNTDTDVE